MSVILVTGGSGAIGAAIVEEFARTDDVIFTYNENRMGALELTNRAKCLPLAMDVTDMSSVDEAVRRILRKFGHIDVLVNNAGISLIKPFLDTSYEEWQRVIDVDLAGVFNVTKAVAEAMLYRKSGAIINISSVWGVHGGSCEVAYSAAKAGVIGFTKALAKELGPSGVTVNAIAPGVIDSPMNTEFVPASELEKLAKDTPMGRLGTTAEVARAVRAIAENRFITGQVLGVDGGFGS